ncbi:diacylglycerol kinase family protein [bacterium]|nr:diacylglycerol kinase family protein [bacterium]
MSKYSHNNFLGSFSTARKGLRLALKSQKNFRYHSIAAIIVLILAVLLKFNYLELCILIFAIGFVMVAELFNSVIEFSLDAYYRNKYSTLVKMAKDMAAGGVLIATTTSILVGIVLFGYKIFIINP